MGRIWTNGTGLALNATNLNGLESDLSRSIKPWAPNTGYGAGQAVLSPNGNVVTANATHTSGTAYTASNWSQGSRVVNVRDYGAKGDGTSDDTTAIQNAINAALALNPIAGIAGGTTNNTATVYLPAGDYKWTSALSFDLAVTATANADRRRLRIAGDNSGGTTLSYTGTSSFMLTLKGGCVTLENLRIVGNATNNLIQLGEDGSTTTPWINQFAIRDVELQNFNIGIRLGWAFDGQFNNCGFFGINTGGVGIDIPYVSTNQDNINNITFIRCHWEKSVGGTFVKLRGGTSPATTHHMLAFVGCHMESRSYNTMFVDAENAWRISFTGGQFTQNNDPNGSSAGITFSNAVSLFRLVNVTSLSFTGGHITRGNTGAYAHKLFTLGGTTAGITANAMLLETKTGVATESKTALWESDATTPYTGPTSTVLDLRGCHINSVTEAEIANEVTSWQDPSQKSNSWNARYNTTTKALTFGYNSSTASWSASRADALSIFKDGMMAPASFIGGTQFTVVNGTTQAFTFTADNNSSRRGLYLIMADTPADGYALVFSNGSALYALNVGSIMAVGSTNPAASGKINVFLSGVNLNINNLYGSDRRVSVIPFGFY
jgi:hypothetical protein